MNTETLVWYVAKREDLPEIAFGIGDFRERTYPTRSESLTPATDVKVAFATDSTGSLDYQPPSVFVLDGQSAPETLSWLRVYARGAFPLSQFARVVTGADWALLSADEPDGRAARTDKWSSVILGEILAQADFEGELDTLPVSRANACFSSAIARTVFLHDSYSVTRTCTERLRDASKDPRFGKRVIPVDMLVPIWAALSANVGDASDIRELTELFLHAADIANDSRPNNHRHRELFNFHSQIFSDSVEERVVAFQRISSEIGSSISLSPSPASHSAAMLALAAFLVGRGTSHAFLLRKFATVAPLAFAWFGLAAALRGPRGWDPAWARVTKGIERQVRSAFHWSDPPAADICWTEYKWLSDRFSGHQALSEIARLAPRSLTIEVVPGATCQFRTSESASRHDQEVRASQATPGLDQEVRAAFESLIALSNKAKRLLDRTEPQTGEQRGLPLEDVNPSPGKSKSKRSSKKSSH
ncbi:hypothetical protein SAMN04487785_1331 [Dyella jiangningensis]|nr:hypothetical protein BDW41_1301 [Dyella sp. AtDHG13]SDL59329.1 hypothetical protein SAMN04487785_1331 [Dyella jiangningensis]